MKVFLGSFEFKLLELKGLEEVFFGISFEIIMSGKRLANLESFAPFGPGNPIPKLILKAAWLKDVIFSGEHARCILQSGRCIFAFRAANSWGIELKRRIGRHVDLLLSVDENSVKIEDAMESQ